MIVATIVSGSSEKIIGDAIQSVIEFVDTVAIVDTGICDGTLEVAQSLLGSRLVVFPFAWVNDFSKARNYSLRIAEELGAAWAMTVDTDERIQFDCYKSKDELRQKLDSSIAVKTWMVPERTGNYSKERFFRIPSKIKWIGRTHECISNFQAEERKSIDGICFFEVSKTKEQFAEKLRRDREILEEEVRLKPKDARWWSPKIRPVGFPKLDARVFAMIRHNAVRRNAPTLGKFEQLESRLLMAANWQNPGISCDVDNSGIVAPVDALIVINSINLNGTRELVGAPTNQTTPFYDVNGDNSISALDVLIIINAINRAMPVLSISSSLSNSQDADNNGVVSGESVELRGATGPNSSLSIRVTRGVGNVLNTISKADASGVFNTSIPLTSGVNRVSIRAVDELGVTAEVTGQLTRGSLVSEWNATLLNELRKLSKSTALAWTPPQAVQTKPPGIARNLAMIYGAMFDAVNAIDGAYEPFLVSLSNRTGANSIAAASAAAHRVASILYSDAENILAWDATYNETLKVIPDNESRRQGIELGRSVADSILASRLNDGLNVTKHLQYGSSPGEWHPTAPIFEAVLPQWPEVAPFVSPNSLFQVEPPPALSSTAYAQAVDEVMRIGGASSAGRTADQTEIARFWADGSGTASPPGHWNQITSDVLTTKQLSLIEQIRAMALVNFAMTDAGIASWKAKYDYDLWRPIDAIQNADVDSNPATQADPTWKPLIVTPPFPAYVSGHSTFSSAASVVLTRLFGPSVNFVSQSDTQSGWRLVSSTEPSPKLRTFTGFIQAAEEAGMSRIYGGIHFNFDNTQGLKLGTDIGEYVSKNALKKR